MDESNNRSIEVLINNLCDTVLVKFDTLDITTIEKYINTLSNSDINIINLHSRENKKYFVRACVESEIYKYIENYSKDSVGQPFDFDNSTFDYQQYIENINGIYKKKFNSNPLPLFFYFVFDRIKEASEQYKFNDKAFILFFRDKYSLSTAKIEAAAKSAEEAADKAEKSAKDAADKAAKEAVAKEAADKAEKAAEDAVNKEMNNVTRHVSETTVTILGIFAAIVLTIVGGFIYSSSIFSSLGTIDILKLICISSLVGFVCIAIITAMFRFIAFLSGKTNENKYIDVITIILSVVLLFIFTTSLLFQFNSKKKSENADNSSVVTSNNSVSDVMPEDDVIKS